MNFRICVIGLGYVGLPLAVEFGKHYKTIGYDINKVRISELKNGFDRTKELNELEIGLSNQLSFTSMIEEVKDSNIYIITVPTPINEFKSPDLNPLLNATSLVGKFLKKNDIVIYESTVYPGCTEEKCVPILEIESGFSYNKDFFCGYSPERINPGDKLNKLSNIVKVTSGSTIEVAEIIDNLYKKIILAGTYKATSIKVAEASKAIENAQRDVNISFVNELALIFDRMGIDTNDVLDAASSKWNFLKFKPGLVGGHCIGVDPYYLAHKAESLGYHPEVILSGRRVNDNMSMFVAQKVIKLLINNEKTIKNSKILILGFTFKENCPDFRNTKVVDIYKELNEFGCDIYIYDPVVQVEDVLKEYSLNFINEKELNILNFEAIILAVSHNEFKSFNLNRHIKNKTIIYDIKSFFPRNLITSRL